jgi:hypothetical protein
VVQHLLRRAKLATTSTTTAVSDPTDLSQPSAAPTDAAAPAGSTEVILFPFDIRLPSHCGVILYLSPSVLTFTCTVFPPALLFIPHCLLFPLVLLPRVICSCTGHAHADGVSGVGQPCVRPSGSWIARAHHQRLQRIARCSFVPAVHQVRNRAGR